MGEIATWSAVKSKVGLGRDGNDCPTKAELLALSPTGTGENYVGLELSNASSYGNNETVKLEDIHKVTYKYTLTVENTTVNFLAIGGSTKDNPMGIQSYKTKYLDGVSTGANTNIGVNWTNRDWISSSKFVFTATENLGLSSRTVQIQFNQNESGKLITVTFTQAAASQSWTYDWGVSPISMSFEATGGTKTFSVTSYKQELRNGHNYGNQITLSYTRANSSSVSGSGTSVTMDNNTSTSKRYGIVTLTQAETNKKATIDCSQSGGRKTYSEITVSGGSVEDIPALGGSISSFTRLPTYSQTWGWNGDTTGGGIITNSGASISYSTPVLAGNLVTTLKPRTQVGTLTGTLSLNGKTKPVSVPVYQAANEITGYIYGPWSVRLTANSYTINNTGGSVTLYPSVSRNKSARYTSGSSEIVGSESATPNLSTNGTPGFSLSGTTLSASANTSTSSRSIRVTASHDGASDYVDITQGGASVSYNYYLNWGNVPGGPTSKSINFTAAPGVSEAVPYISYYKKEINGIETSDIYPVDIFFPEHPSWVFPNLSDNGILFNPGENIVESPRSGTVIVRQSESLKEITITVNQDAATITYEYRFTYTGNYIS